MIGPLFGWGSMRLVSILKLAALAAPLALAAPAAAHTNLDFENGLDGWATNITDDGDGFPLANYGTTDAIGSLNARSPGDWFGYIYAGLGENVPTTLSQTIHLSAGQTLAGFVAFIGGEDPDTYGQYNDWAGLSINGSSLFGSSITQIGSAMGTTGWVPFSYTATSDGNYLLELRVANDGDNSWHSGAALDDITLSQPGQGAVPESATWAMMVLGFGFAGTALRARRRTISFV